jgi:hypothetical protein
MGPIVACSFLAGMQTETRVSPFSARSHEA